MSYIIQSDQLSIAQKLYAKIVTWKNKLYEKIFNKEDDTLVHIQSVQIFQTFSKGFSIN